MKFSVLLTFILSLLISINANATLLTLADVGAVDRFIASATLEKSSNDTELTWVRDILGHDNIFLNDGDKYDSVESDWSLIEGDIYATELKIDPGYFLLKFGGGVKSGATHFLYENVGNLSFAVIDFADTGLISITKIHMGKISHVDEFSATPNTPQGTPPAPIPEPMTISLFALALLGLARRKK
ncbi:hypothetical protein CMT41_16895 [Colwellia sp. MT41]|uniref:PEP-CTERM sorting domain-containing protein n=1 Tax=Colwellia sp. MT41 TaxID=58049 RepID=UPI0007177751|nr:PEP-CTERM sorting domain-containing protein [Colwellia sp. MT41]ALO36222.1 hypothetical protein CMT41_16895 [Colwellia sp. MT41]